MSESFLETLWQGALTGKFEPGSREIDLDDGQNLQVALQARWRQQGFTIGGWKLGMTSGQSRDIFGPGIRPFGFILADRILNSGATISCSVIGKAGIENELCFTMGSALGGDATRDGAIAAVESVAPAFEVNQRRIVGAASPGIRIADNLSNWGLIVGAPVPVPDDLSNFVVVLSNLLAPEGKQEIERISARDHIDDHFTSIATLARGLAEHGLSLNAGDRVITGAFTRTPLSPGRYVGRFGTSMGEVSVVVEP